MLETLDITHAKITYPSRKRAAPSLSRSKVRHYSSNNPAYRLAELLNAALSRQPLDRKFEFQSSSRDPAQEALPRKIRRPGKNTLAPRVIARHTSYFRERALVKRAARMYKREQRQRGRPSEPLER